MHARGHHFESKLHTTIAASVVLLLLSVSEAIQGMEPSAVKPQTPYSMASIVVPGVGGGGQSSFDLLIPAQSDIYRLEPLARLRCDLGQHNCTSQLTQLVEQADIMNSGRKLLFFGASQGTATTINWLADLPEEHQSKIACICLEAPLTNGNSAVLSTVESYVSPALNYLPFARFLLPLAAKTQLPAYNPLGRQALASAHRLPKNIPIILLHCIHDPEVSINSARTLYCTLRSQGHNNVYLFELYAQYNHIELFGALEDTDFEEVISALYTIYRQNNISLALQPANTNADLQRYQPPIQEVEQKIQESSETKRLKKTEKNRSYLRWPTGTWISCLQGHPEKIISSLKHTPFAITRNKTKLYISCKS